jgi:hypothetical protein
MMGVVFFIGMLSFIVLSVIHRYAECRCAECRGAQNVVLTNFEAPLLLR